jgi:hypothetical protein
MRLTLVLRERTFAAQRVFATAYDFHVQRVYTVANAAQMIDGQVAWDITAGHFVRDAMGKTIVAPVEPHSSVAGGVNVAKPMPATIRRALDVFAEPKNPQ